MKNLLQKLLLTALLVALIGPLSAQPYMLDISAVERIKARLETGESRTEALHARLLRDAEKVLFERNPTVMDKGVTPPSGDKHDYISMGRYWWPNPATPDGLPYVRRDGESNPELKKFDRDRLGLFSSRLSTLTAAFLVSEKPDYGRKIASMLRTWFLDKKSRMNPNATYAQMVPGRYDGLGRPEGVLDTYSLLAAVDAALVVEQAGYLSKKEAAALRGWFATYIDWLCTSPSGIGEFEAENNHGVAYDVQTLLFALYAGKQEVVDMLIAGFPERRLAAQIEPDGRQPRELARTTAFGYSVFNLTHLLDMCTLARSQGVDLYHAADHAIDRAIRYLIPFLGNQSTFPYKQIKDWSKVEQEFARQLLRAANLSGNEEYRLLYERYRTRDEQRDARFILFNER